MITPGKYPLQWDALQIGWEQFKILSWRALVSEYWCSVYRRGSASGDRALQPLSHFNHYYLLPYHPVSFWSRSYAAENHLAFFCIKLTLVSGRWYFEWVYVMEFSCRLKTDFIFESHYILVSLKPYMSNRICIFIFVSWRKENKHEMKIYLHI